MLDIPGDGTATEETGLTVFPEVRGDWFVEWQGSPLITSLTLSLSGSALPADSLPGAAAGIVPAGSLPGAGAGGG